MKKLVLLRDVFVARYTKDGVLNGSAVRVNPVDGYFTHPIISPDGTRVAYWGRSTEGLEVWVADLSAHSAEPVIPGPGTSCHPAWSPDSSQLAYAFNPVSLDDAASVSLYDGPRLAPRDIWILNLNTGIHQRVTFNGLDNERPAWSPDGRCIAHVTGDGEDKNIRITELFSGVETGVTELNGIFYRPAWHPSGHQLAFNNKGPGSHFLWIIDVDGRNLRQVTHSDSTGDTVHDHGSFWSSNGQDILFHSDRGGTWGLWILHIEDSQIRPVSVPGISSIGHASWDAREKWICFDASR